MATGGLLLAISAIFATKANKKFTQVTTLKGGSADYAITYKASGATVFTTKGGGTERLVYAQFLTTTGTAAAIVNVQMYTVTGVKPVYFKN